VTSGLLALALAAALPSGSARVRAELAGTAVGTVDLSVACGPTRCDVRYRSRLRLPAESGGGVTDASVEVEVDRAGRYRGGALRFRRDGAARGGGGPEGAVPAALVEVVLAVEAPADGAEVCVPFFDEERPALRRACARRDRDGTLAADEGGVPVRIVPGADGLPHEVVVAGRFRYVRDAAAVLPRDPPRLAGTRIPGPADPAAARVFCGVPPDPVPDAARAQALPPPVAAGASCREKTAAWLAAARARGLDGRTAVGAAWDGRAFVWHAWPEVRVGDAWIPVDPSFGQRPARGPRFTVARYGDHDPAARDAAGGRILGCWGAGVVE
jgi:hypothetical protein